MSKSPASDSRPMPTSWVRISEPSSSHLQKFEEDEVNCSSLITFPTDQVPQPVTRDTIATTTMAASTDSRGSACLPQSAPTVQAQVFSTVAGCVSCDDCTHINLNATKRHNQRDEEEVADEVDEERRGVRAGPPAVSAFPCRPDGRGVPSVIASRSCPLVGNSNSYVNHKMQSVNVTTAKNHEHEYVHDVNCLLFECNTAVTVPNTKPQRNTDGPVVRAANNNSDKLAVVIVSDKENHGALNRSAMESQLHTQQYNAITTVSATRQIDDIPSYKSDEQHYLDIDNDAYITFDRLVALTKRTRRLDQLGALRPRLGLYGGGESSLSTGTTGWGTPPATNTNNNNGWGSTSSNNQNNSNNQQNWNNNPNRSGSGNQSGPGPVTSDANSNKSVGGGNNSGNQVPVGGQQGSAPQSSQASSGWQQTSNKPAGPQGVVPPTSVAPPTSSTQQQSVSTGAPASSTKQQLEQLNNMREALFAQDGWGGQHVNQDTNWDIPSSPEPQLKMDGSGPPQWKPTVNNGTDLWEVNLRNGGQPPPQPAQKTPWGHTPSTNIGGTWGEDDDVADSSNVWTGVPSGQQQWGGATNGAMWPGPKKESDWGNSGWGDPRSGDPRGGGGGGGGGLDPREMRIDPRDMRAAGSEAIRMLDPRDQLRLVSGGDPRGGISGRLNGAQADAMWGQPGPQGPHHLHHQPGKMVGPGANTTVNQWAGPPPPAKELTMGGKPTGWEEPSPPSQRRNMSNYDDGTSLWGNPAQQGRVAAGSNLSHWKELPTGPTGNMGRGNGNMGLPPGMAARGLKPDAGVGGGGGGATVWRNGTAWDETGVSHAAAWDEPAKWADGGGGAWPAKPTKAVPGPLWDTDMEWGHKTGPKPLSKEMVWNSKQFRLLVDMGYKKEDAESALRARDMNLEDALDLLSLQRSSIDGWRARHDEHFDHQNAGPFPGQRFGPAGPSAQMPFPPTGNQSLLNSMNSGNSAASNNPSLASINSMSPAIVHKMLNQGASNQGFGSSAGTGRSLQSQSQPSTQQLRMLVQQIQMAVQAGYLNHQILNQPLAPQTLLLLNQLLQQIKNLQQLMSQQQMAQSQGSLGKPNSQMVLQCSVLITKTKQQIQNLQNQIAAQQAIYVKQQHVGGAGAATPADFFKTNMHDSINALQSNFGELALKDPQSSYQNQQSRLNQWKLPALDKESDAGNEFSRAPGPVTKPLAPSHSSPNLNPLGLGQSDGPWSTGRSAEASGWPDAGNAGDTGPPDVNKDREWATPAQPSLTDLVPEFEPGKPWKGNQIKSIEDDPSITPGSVVRSPLSLATIKDSEIFNSSSQPSKSSPPGVSATDTIQPLSLSSSTWSFNPPTTSRLDDPLGKIASSKATWGDSAPPPTAVTSELWGVPMAGKARGPPPGLAKGASSLGLAVNGWGSRGSWGSQPGTANWGSPWLLLRNLTAQIDGSTLRTLCMQHGPLQSFHLYLHQGFALVKYSSREEATKAQTALNNCVLGNTTILAESPAESDANNLLQQLAPQQSAGSGGWRASAAPNKPPPSAAAAAADTWNTGWPSNPASASLWGAAPLDSADAARATPSSLNSFLPGDLLGGESM